MKSSIEKLLNRQLNIEHAAYFHYMEMSTYAESMGLKGISKWLRHQAYEEMEHMMRYYHFIYDRDGIATFTTLKEKSYSFKTVKDIFIQALKNEEYVTKTSYELLEKAQALKDHATVEFTQWYVKEQLEEEALMRDILNEINLLGKDSRALYFLDKDLGSQVSNFHDYRGDE
ncbi:ferritin [Candidatus Marinamargulisbacteria bacterium SCGC AG-439-L15]|nr:ferritin [Candidatus Marinamargulisbacteria bacterium SCGC AG-439-L15]